VKLKFVRLGTILFLAHFVILAACLSYPAMLLANRIRVGYLESAEEPLVDAANILAAFVGRSTSQQELDTAQLYAVFSDANNRELSAAIYGLQKRRVDLDVYITNRDGIVVFDSHGRENVGADYSQWRDVSRTLKGQYGARVGRLPNDPDSPAVLYVAAPIRANGEITGVLTVAKPTTSTYAFMSSTKQSLLSIGALAVAIAIFLSLLLSLWVTQQVNRLTHYADEVRDGQRVPFPKLAKTELLTMGLAFERMRASLAGQAYVERYVQTLTHEIKSPISAIRGAAEILESSSLDDQQRAHFLRNIQNETKRIHDLVERMLKLSELEVQRALPEQQRTLLLPIVNTVLESKGPFVAKKEVQVEIEVPEDLTINADPFLIHLALSNLLQNALEFSPMAGRVRVHAGQDADSVVLAIDDTGPGIPEFAKEKVFDRFFSLERPDTGRKSTGLGLNFVKEIAQLHQGQVHLENLPSGGLRATLRLPA
jgi:two-component system sensor histidine kinase CreC